MLHQCIIRPGMSPFSASVLLVCKKDKTWRFYVDYHELNVKMVKDNFPIPIVNEFLDELKGARFFTKQCLHSGYHQVLMQQEDITKMVFRMHHGHFEFLVMSFGLTNTPSTFQVLHAYHRRFMLVFFMTFSYIAAHGPSICNMFVSSSKLCATIGWS
jgi:hypothetical protein